MAPRITGSADRKKRQNSSSNRPITQGQNPQRSNRQGVSQATVSNGDSRTRTGTAKVTSGQEPPKPPVTRQSRVNGRLKPGTDTRPSPNTRASAKPDAKPAGPNSRQTANANYSNVRMGNGLARTQFLPNSNRAGTNLPSQAANALRKPQNSSSGTGGGNAKPPVRGTPQAEAWLKQQLKNQNSTAVKGSKVGNFRSGVAGAAVQAVSDQFLAPQVRKLGTALGQGPLTAVGRFIDDRRPGINSKDEARRRDPSTGPKDTRTTRLANTIPSRPVGTKETLNGQPVYWDGYKWSKTSGSAKPARSKAPKAPKLPAASTTASRSSSSSGSGSSSSSGSSRPSIRAAASAPKKPQPGQSKDMNENYQMWAKANPKLAAKVKSNQSGYNAIGKDAVAGVGPVKDGASYKPQPQPEKTSEFNANAVRRAALTASAGSVTDSVSAPLDNKKKKKVNG